jgi:hypothetical protein
MAVSGPCVKWAADWGRASAHERAAGIEPGLRGDDEAEQPRRLSGVLALPSPGCGDAAVGHRIDEEQLHPSPLAPGAVDLDRDRVKDLGQ